MARGACLGVVVAAMLALVVPRAEAACPAWGTELQPADGKTLLVIGQHRDAIDQYVAGTGNTPGGLMVYTSIAAPQLGLLVPFDQGGFVHDMQYLLSRYPRSAMQIGLHMKETLAAVNAGALDGQILHLATILKDANRPIYLRIGYEFDGAHNAYEPTAYVQAYRRIVERLRMHGASNVSFVWHSVASSNRYLGRPLSAWYPGDCYVDWAGVSLFGHPYNNGAGMAAANEMANFADARDIPIMIAESTPHGREAALENGDALWNAWFQTVVDWINARDVKVWSYINQHWEAAPQWANWGDSRVEVNPALEARWMSEIAKPRYLSASPTLFCGELHWC